jgi:Cu(I)/Ag(I) efflux system membrane fusion protein
MKKTLLSVIALALVSTATISCTSNEKQSEKMEMEAGVQYTCPMHPEVVADKPGSCPKCGMDLVKKEPEKMEMKHDSIMKGDSTMKM